MQIVLQTKYDKNTSSCVPIATYLDKCSMFYDHVLAYFQTSQNKKDSNKHINVNIDLGHMSKLLTSSGSIIHFTFQDFGFKPLIQFS